MSTQKTQTKQTTKKKMKNLLSKFSNKDNYLQKIELTAIQKEQLVEKGYIVGEEEIVAKTFKVKNLKVPETYNYVIFEGVKVYLLFPNNTYFHNVGYGKYFFEKVNQNLIEYIDFLRETTVLHLTEDLSDKHEIMAFTFYLGFLYGVAVKFKVMPDYDVIEFFENTYHPETTSAEVYNEQLEMFKNIIEFSKKLEVNV